jgi:hypothetical protein
MQGNNNGHKTTLERVWCCTLLKYCGRVCTPLRPAPPPPPPRSSSSSKRARSGPESLAQLLVHRLTGPPTLLIGPRPSIFMVLYPQRLPNASSC